MQRFIKFVIAGLLSYLFFYTVSACDLNSFNKDSSLSESSNSSISSISESTSSTRQYVIKFDTSGGTLIEDILVDYGQKLTKPESPRKENHIFVGWYRNNNLYNFDSLIVENVDLTALWITQEEYLEVQNFLNLLHNPNLTEKIDVYNYNTGVQASILLKLTVDDGNVITYLEADNMKGYMTNLNDFVYSAILQSNVWSYTQDPIDTSYLDITEDIELNMNEFTKRINANIYDFIINPEIMNILLPQPLINYAKLTINLDSRQILLKFAYKENGRTNLCIDITLFDLGTTIIEDPTEIIKQDMIKVYNDYLLDSQELVILESNRTSYEDMINSYITNVNSQSNIANMIETHKNSLEVINSFEFESESGSEGLVFDLYYNVYKITGYTGDDTDVIIPSHYKGKKVVLIDKEAFANNTNIQSVTINDGIHTIDENAFKGCTNLLSIELPNSITTINIYAFASCSNIEYIKLPNNLYYIDDFIFKDCINLKSVDIPQKTSRIESSAFYGCIKLENFTFYETSNFFVSVNGVLYDKQQTMLIRYAPGKLDTDFIVPNTVSEISYGAFSYCINLKSLTIPEGIKTLSGFNDCTSLETVNLPSTITTIYDYTFKGCSSLVSVTIPKNVSYIGDGIFAYCDKLTNINVDVQNERYISMDGNLYSKYTGFIQYAPGKTETSFIVPFSISYIQEAAFEGCKNLVSVSISENVDYIYRNTFANCINLKEVNLSKVYDLSYGAFHNCTSLEKIIIPKTVRYFGDAFDGCKKIVMFMETTGPGSQWSGYWNPNNKTVYWFGTWHFDENNQPVPNN